MRLLTRLDEIRANEETERAERRQRAYEDALGITHKPGPAAKPYSGPVQPRVPFDTAAEDRRWAERQRRDGERLTRVWDEYLRKRDPNAICKCGRFAQVCKDAGGCGKVSRGKPTVIIMEDIHCRRCPNTVKHEGDLCGICEQEQAEVMADLHKER